jgi:hypothetical protein
MGDRPRCQKGNCNWDGSDLLLPQEGADLELFLATQMEIYEEDRDSAEEVFLQSLYDACPLFSGGRIVDGGAHDPSDSVSNASPIPLSNEKKSSGLFSKNELHLDGSSANGESFVSSLGVSSSSGEECPLFAGPPPSTRVSLLGDSYAWGEVNQVPIPTWGDSRSQPVVQDLSWGWGETADLRERIDRDEVMQRGPPPLLHLLQWIIFFC